MNKYSQNATLGTSGPMLAGMFATLFASHAGNFADQAHHEPAPQARQILIGSYQSNTVAATFVGSIGKIEQVKGSIENFDDSVNVFFQKLSNNQILLDEDFSRILADNLWDLYAE